MNIWYEGHLEHPTKCPEWIFEPQKALQPLDFEGRKKNFFENLGVSNIEKYNFWVVGQKNDFWAKFLSRIYTLYTKSGSI